MLHKVVKNVIEKCQKDYRHFFVFPFSHLCFIFHISEDWSIECNTNKTPDVNDETTSRKKDVWNIICQGAKIGEYSYQKRKAAAKCAKPDLKIRRLSLFGGSVTVLSSPSRARVKINLPLACFWI